MNDIWPHVTLVRNFGSATDSRQRIVRQAREGSMVRISRGAYVDSGAWQQLGPREQHILVARTMSEQRRDPPVLSHLTAAAIHDLPVLEPWPKVVHTIVGKTAGGSSTKGIARHAIPLDDGDIVEVDGLRVTSLARTVIDLAATLPLLGAVAAADRALRVDRFGHRAPLVTIEQLRRRWEDMLPFRNHTRVLRALDLADGLSGSPLESVSRVNMCLIGVPKPVLQQSFSDGHGWIGDTDFWWEAFNLVGEADGAAKYLDPKLRNGKTADQVVLDEKMREDRLRALPKNLVRWRWAVGINPARLWKTLSGAGLPRGVAW